MRSAFNDEDRQCIEAAPFFFLSTATAESVDCSFKGGEPGFVRVAGDNTIVTTAPAAPLVTTSTW